MTARSTFSYQDSLRAIGAWLDIRGYRDVRIVEAEGELIIEAKTGSSATATMEEVLRFDHAGVIRLRQAALSDRGAPRSPLSLIPNPELTPLYAREHSK